MKINETRKLTDEKWLNLYETTFESNGNSGKWIFASRNRKGSMHAPDLDKISAVTIVPIFVGENGERKLVLIKEYRVPIQTYEYHFPAGLLEGNETIEDCARRELKEEAGYDVNKVLCVSPSLTSSAGLTDETSVIVFVECNGDGKAKLDAHEEIEVGVFSYKEVCEYANSKFLFAAKTWTILMMFKALGSLNFKTKQKKCQVVPEVANLFATEFGVETDKSTKIIKKWLKKRRGTKVSDKSKKEIALFIKSAFNKACKS